MGAPPQIVVAPDPRAAAEAAAAEVVRAVQTGLNARGRAAIALSGGSTPRELHRLLAQPPVSEDLPWPRVHLFWVDERLVPYSDAASNFGAARHDLIEPLGLRTDQVHPMPVKGAPAVLAAAYENVLRAHFGARKNRPPAFDLICLGLGADGHTASLFPEDPALDEARRWTVAATGGRPPVDRLTLTFPVLNRARRILLLVTGETKAGIVKKVMAHPEAALPVQRIVPVAGSVVWVLDRPAATLLSEMPPLPTVSAQGEKTDAG